MNNNISILFNSNQKDYTFNDYNNLKLYKQSAIQCLFNGSRFNNCLFDECNFSRSDFEGTLNSKIIIKNTKYQNADIKSNVWRNCTFINCDFSNAYLSDNEYINCLFENCSFCGGVALKNQFKECAFKSSDFSGSSFTKNIFSFTSFTKTSLGNCSFYKQILHNCSYADVSMNVDSLGQIFGLNKETVESITYIFLGKPLGAITNENVSELIDAFRKKNWFYEIINLKTNLGLLSNYEYINSIAEFLVDKVKSNCILNADEVDFFVMVMNYLYDNESLPLFSSVYSYNLLRDTINELRDKSNIIKLKEIIINLQFNINNMTSKLVLSYEKEVLSFDNNSIIDIMLHYENPTIIDFSKLINLYVSIFRLSEKDEATLRTVKQGTYIEYIATTVLGVFALKAILYGIKGILLEVVDIKNGIKQLSDSKVHNPEIIIKESENKRNIIFKNIDNLIKNINSESNKEFSIISRLIEQVVFKK